MKKNALLSIVIPTYNRARFLDKCLDIQIPIARKHGIAIYISDNASTDDTKLVVEKRKKDYSYIEYSKNTENVGADKNFEIALKIPDQDYVWLMGDTYHIPEELMELVLRELLNNEKSFDYIILNANSRVCDTPSQHYSDKNKLLRDLGWHMTCMSSLVYKKSAISNANFTRYRDTYFIQVGIIFEYIEDKMFSICWIDFPSVENITIYGLKKNSWQSITFEIWVNRWSNFVFSLPPSYKLESKLECIRSHGIKSGLFSIKGLLLLRAAGLLDYALFKKYNNIYLFAINRNKLLIFIICSTPIVVLNTFRKLVKKFNR